MTDSKMLLRRIVKQVRTTIYYLLQIIIFGGSLKAGLEIHLEVLAGDINEALENKATFDQDSISIIGNYVAIVGIALGLLMCSRIYNGDIRNRLNFAIAKIFQAVGSWGLASFVLQFLLFTNDAICRAELDSTSQENCPFDSNQMALKQFCCLIENKQHPERPIVNVNGWAYLLMAMTAFKITKAMPIYRLEFKKGSLNRIGRFIFNPLREKQQLSFLLSRAAEILIAPTTSMSVYFLMRYSNSSYSIYTTMTTLITYYAMEGLSYGTFIANSPNIIDKTTVEGITASAGLAGSGGAALLHTLAAVILRYPLTESSGRITFLYAIPAVATALIIYQELMTETLSESLKKKAGYLLPAFLVKKLRLMPAGAAYAHRTNKIFPNFKNITPRKLGRAAFFGLLTYASLYMLTLTIEDGVSSTADPLDRGPSIFRYALTGFGWYYFASQTYKQTLDISRTIQVRWPTLPDILTAGLMSLFMYLATRSLAEADSEHANIQAAFFSSLFAVALIIHTPVRRGLSYLINSCKNLIGCCQATNENPDVESQSIISDDPPSSSDEDNYQPLVEGASKLAGISAILSINADEEEPPEISETPVSEQGSSIGTHLLSTDDDDILYLPSPTETFKTAGAGLYNLYSKLCFWQAANVEKAAETKSEQAAETAPFAINNSATTNYHAINHL